jgi:hypothetical protein
MSTSPTLKPALPPWAESLRSQFISDECSQFLVHGNVYDYYPFRGEYLPLRRFLSEALLADKWTLFYNRSEGMVIAGRGQDSVSPVWISELAQSIGITDEEGHTTSLPVDPEKALTLLDRIVQTSRLANRNYAIVMDYVEMLLPASSISFLGPDEKKHLVTVHRWAYDADLRLSNGVVLLIAETLSDVNDRIRSHPNIGLIEVPFPALDERLDFIRWLAAKHYPDVQLKLPPENLAELLSGLTLVDIENLFRVSHKDKRPIDFALVAGKKNHLIDKASSGFLEVVHPEHTVADCAGHDAAKKKIRREIAKIQAGEVKKCSAGIILIGEMGTGKTYLSFAIAFEFGLPVVIIKNLLGGLVGLSDSNQERILSLLKAMAPILVIVDEGDVFFGKRKSEGDSGVQSRQFGRYATFMSDPDNRGRVFWIINSAHPDNLADDFKRPGRCDIVIPLFPMLDPGDQRTALEKIFARQHIAVGNIEWEPLLASINALGPDGFPVRELTVSDLSKIASQAEELAADRGSKTVEMQDLETAITNYSAGATQMIKKYQRLLAITESTVPEAVPKPYCDMPLQDIYRLLREMKLQLGDRV